MIREMIFLMNTINKFSLLKIIYKFALSFGVVAQLVEQRTENPCVIGSTPIDATLRNKRVSENEVMKNKPRFFILFPN